VLSSLRSGRGAPEADFDGCAELWWDSLEDYLAVRQTPEGVAALKALFEDDQHFVDFSRSLYWYGQEHPVIGV
jgi:hypothetical protein